MSKLLEAKIRSSQLCQDADLTSELQRQASPIDLHERERSQGILHRIQELADRTDREFDQLEDKLEENYLNNLMGSLRAVPSPADDRPASVRHLMTGSPASSRLTPTGKEDVNRPHSSALRRGFFKTGGSIPSKPTWTRKPTVRGMPPDLQAGTSLIISFPIQRSPRPVGGRALKDPFYGVAGRPRSPDPGWQVFPADESEMYDGFQEVNHSSFFSMAPGTSTPRCHSSCSTRRGDNLPPKPWTRWQAKQQATPQSLVQSARGCRSELDTVKHNRKVLFAETNKGLMGGAAFVS